jgi:hypothetical protein
MVTHSECVFLHGQFWPWRALPHSCSGLVFGDALPERLTDFLVETDQTAAAEMVRLIEEAVELLIGHPLMFVHHQFVIAFRADIEQT